jgi:heterotetrameric sarcosine oxidase delta subunit
MLRISCPWCGERDEIEFRYRGDATRRRPAAGAALEQFLSYVYERDNPLGWHTEWWLHVGGCGQLLKVVRHTMTHEIRFVGSPADEPPRRGGDP